MIIKTSFLRGGVPGILEERKIIEKEKVQQKGVEVIINSKYTYGFKSRVFIENYAGQISTWTLLRFDLVVLITDFIPFCRSIPNVK